MIRAVWAGLFGIDLRVRLEPGPAWIALAAVCAVSLVLLSRRIRAYEVVR